MLSSAVAATVSVNLTTSGVEGSEKGNDYVFVFADGRVLHF